MLGLHGTAAHDKVLCHRSGVVFTHQALLLHYVVLQDAQQNISRLQQLSAQLQQLAAAVQKATPPVSQPDPNRPAAWAKGVQDSAQQAAAALQDELTAALSSPSCNQLWPNPSAQHAGGVWKQQHSL